MLRKTACLPGCTRYPEVTFQAAQQLTPNLVCTYLDELAARYNRFYQHHSVLQADQAQARQFRLVLTQATSQILKHGLGLLGIATPEKM